MSAKKATRKTRKPVKKGAFAILVGGGPAPGINGVISAATIEAIENGHEVYGLEQGFKWISRGDLTHARRLTIEDVSRINYRGGSILRTSRHNPQKSPQDMKNVVSSLRKLGVKYLITIGGDDTGTSAAMVAEATKGSIAVAHVPKTIDNDLPLPSGMPTFGFQTARAVGDGIVKNLMEDAKTTANRWYICVAMGRTAGHLSLGIGKSAGATVTVIPEEFRRRKVTLKAVCDIIEGSIIKRLAAGRDFGVAILAEGLAVQFTEKELASAGNIERDDHGHIRLSEINLGSVVKQMVRKSLAEHGLSPTLVEKDLGYELRCADPVPFDADYTRDLGYGAVRFLLKGGSKALVAFIEGRLTPLTFKSLIDPKTKRIRVRQVDVKSESYQVARSYMIRLEKSDFEDPKQLAALAKTANMTPKAFTERFGYLQNL